MKIKSGMSSRLRRWCWEFKLEGLAVRTHSSSLIILSGHHMSISSSDYFSFLIFNYLFRLPEIEDFEIQDLEIGGFRNQGFKDYWFSYFPEDRDPRVRNNHFIKIQESEIWDPRNTRYRKTGSGKWARDKKR